MPILTKDQERAAHAYRCVQEVGQDIKEYKIAVNSLAANIKRSGLAAAMAFLEREDRKANKALVRHLSSAGIPGFNMNQESLTRQVSTLGLQEYMLATRELLRRLIWFRRAVQAHAIPPIQGE